MSEWTNCPNCGAVVDPAADRCAYCETPYPTRLRADRYEIRIDPEMLARVVDVGIMTPNEARRRLGMRQIREV